MSVQLLNWNEADMPAKIDKECARQSTAPSKTPYGLTPLLYMYNMYSLCEKRANIQRESKSGLGNEREHRAQRFCLFLSLADAACDDAG